MCVEAFRAGRLRFVDIVPTVGAVLATHDVPSDGGLTVEDVLGADAWARAAAATTDRRARMTAVYYTLGVVIFFVAILASIGLHEFGHMIPAKKFGGKVTQWFIGFGPTVWSKQIGETEYGVKAIPLGGYVKIVGMLPPGAEDLDEDRDDPVYDDEGNRVVRVRKSNTGIFTQLISDARAAEWEHVKPGDEDRLFYKMAWWKKVIVMAGGPTVNLLIAFFLFWGVFGSYRLRRPGRDPAGGRRGDPLHRPRRRGRPRRARPRSCARTPRRRARPGCSRATASSPSTASRSPTGSRSARRSGATARRPRRSASSATASCARSGSSPR